MNEDVIYKPVPMEEVAVALGASTVHTAKYFAYCLQVLDFLGFSICKKEVNKGEPSGLIESADIKPFNNPCDSCDDKSGCSRCSFF